MTCDSEGVGNLYRRRHHDRKAKIAMSPQSEGDPMLRPSGRPLADHFEEYLTSRPEFVELLAPAAAAFVDFLQFCGAATKAIAQRIAELPPSIGCGLG